MVDDADLNDDGTVDAEELTAWDQHRKFSTQRRIAVASFVFMLAITAVLLPPLISESRVAALSALLSTMYIANAGIVGAFMGVTAWMANKK